MGVAVVIELNQICQPEWRPSRVRASTRPSRRQGTENRIQDAFLGQRLYDK